MSHALVPAGFWNQGERRSEHHAAQCGRDTTVVSSVERAVVAIVAAEQFIAAVAADDDLYMIASKFSEQPSAQAQRIRGFIERPYEIGQQRGDFGVHTRFVMLRAE